MELLSALLFIMVSLTALCCLAVRLFFQVPLGHSVALWSAAVSLVAFGVLRSYGYESLALMVLGLGYSVVLCAVLYFWLCEQFLDLPHFGSQREPVAVTPPLPTKLSRPSMYQRVQEAPPHTLRRALKIVHDQKLLTQIEALLIMHKQGKRLRAVV